MKKQLLTILLSCCILTISAQDPYYYSGKSRIALRVNPSKVVAIYERSTAMAPSMSGLSLVDTISDARCAINVYEITDPETNGTNQSYRQLLSDSQSVNFQPCYFIESDQEVIPTGYIHIKLKKAEDYAILQNIAQQFNCEIIKQNSFMPLWYNVRALTTAGRNSVDIANAIYETGLFAASSPDFAFDAIELSYDPDIVSQWGLYNSEYPGYDISISKAWNYSTGFGINIAIIDQGIELTHKDLAQNIHFLSYDTETGTSPSKVYSDDGHGTHCAGIAAAVRHNGIQIAGVAPDAKLMSVSNVLKDVSNFIQNLADGINWAWQNGADVISCSWWCAQDSMIVDAIDAAITHGRGGKGCIVVKSAGNKSGPITFPGNYRPEVLAVANMTQSGILATDSNHGANMFVSAPGTNILSTKLNNKRGYMSGTSMACPHVAGLAALILARNPSLTAAEVHELIARNAKKIGDRPYDTIKPYGTWNEYYGYGLIDAYNSVINTPRNIDN